MLRIHDLKTGTTPAHMQQLEIYAALFFLEYKQIKLENSSVELRIYQSEEVMVYEPSYEIIKSTMERIKDANDILMSVKGEEL